MTFRAPELFDVKTGITLDEKVDIWVRTPCPLPIPTNPNLRLQSLGCTLYALAYNRSPFETAEQAGGSIAMAVQSGAYKQPNSTAYSQGMRELIDACLKVDARERPDIHKVRSSLVELVRDRVLMMRSGR
jgi:serine/threonine kinase 16